MFTEKDLENLALKWFREIGYDVIYGPELIELEERESTSDVVLKGRLKKALYRINPDIEHEAIEEAFHRIVTLSHANLEDANHIFHTWLREGIRVDVKTPEGWRGRIVKLFDFENPKNNDFLVVNQLRVTEGRKYIIPDIVVFINGLPIGIIELKDPTDVNATIYKAYSQLQRYKRTVPRLFYYNEVLAITDGKEARHGTITSPFERFAPWKTIKGVLAQGMPPLEVLIKGIFYKDTVLELMRDFVVFEKDGGKWTKKMAMYHQYDAVKIAVERTLKAVKGRDKRIGVVWHTQGAGKSLTMTFYAAKLLSMPELNNPLIVVLTDRNDLDNQLFKRFVAARELLSTTPIQAESVEELKKLLSETSGGVIFSTVQKFKPESGEFPTLNTRENVIVIADEAHRSHYNFISGYAKFIRQALPNASFIGFTGTPIELGDKSTVQVFGDYIHIYDMASGVEDGVIVPIYYENRLIKVGLEDHSKEILDEKFEEVTELEEREAKEKLKYKWSRLEAVLGADEPLEKVAKDIVEHFEKRLRTLEGKAMIVCISRRVCAELYKKIIALRPEWHSDDDRDGVIKVVISGSADDPEELQPHIRSKSALKLIEQRFKDPNDKLKIVLVRDMWLTGFDVLPLHTMYIYKPMKGHTLMQAIARVNRVWRDKPAGLIVDYVGIGPALAEAVSKYTKADQQYIGVSLEDALPILKEKYDVVSSFLYGIDFKNWKKLDAEAKLNLLLQAVDRVSKNDDIKRRFTKAVVALSKAFALAVPHEEALKIRDDLEFFQAVKNMLIKSSSRSSRPSEPAETAVKQLVSGVITADKVIDILTLKEDQPDLSVLSDEFLNQILRVKYENLRIELLRKLLEDQIRVRMKRNYLRYKSFKELLERTIQRYHNNAITSAEVIKTLIELARELRKAAMEGKELGLSEEELAFYDALAQGIEGLEFNEEVREIVRELVNTIKRNLTIDWTKHEMVKSRIRASVKRLLRRKGFKPKKTLIENIMKQAETLYKNWPSVEA